MALIYGKEDEKREGVEFSGFRREEEKAAKPPIFCEPCIYFDFSLLGQKPNPQNFWYAIYQIHWPITFVLLAILAYAYSLVY